MQPRPDRGRQLALFILRNLVLYFLLVNSFLQLREQLDPLFQTAAFLAAVLAALAMEKSRLRTLPALAIAAAVPVLLRILQEMEFERVGGKTRVDGLTLKATDIEYSVGSGPVVEGPAISLLLAASGRHSAIDELSGPGVETLRARR